MMTFKRILCGFLCALMIFSLVPDFRLMVKAEEGELQEGQSNIDNGSFEDPVYWENDPKNNGYKTDAQNIPGWKTTAIDKKFELGWLKTNGESPHMIPTVEAVVTAGNGASDGLQFAETVGNEPSTLYQSLTVNAEMTYSWTVHHRGRGGVDTLALFFVKDTGVKYEKNAKAELDHFDKIIAWMKNTKGISAPGEGEMEHYTVYTTALLDNGAFTESVSGYFSFSSDAEHTVKFDVYLMSTGKDDWGEYSGKYVSNTNGNVLFALTCFKSHSSSQTYGNLVDNLSFYSVQSEKNMLANPGFEDAEVTSASGYQMLTAANHKTSATKKIGWCSTASDYKVEVGSLRGGNDAYGLGVTIETVTKNAPSVRDGKQFAELNATEESSLYQIVDTDPGKMYRWSLSHRGRSGVDTMALVIGPNQANLPKKTSKTARDQLMQIVDWLYTQPDVVLDIPDSGCSAEIKLYTPKFNDSGGFEGDGKFTWYADETHTEEWSVWIISSDISKWHDYGENEKGATSNYDYIVPTGQENSIFGFVSVKAGGTNDKSYGNLLDNIAFKEYYYVNAKFDGGESFGIVTVDPEHPDHFISTDDLDSNEVGWSLAGSNITISFQEQDRIFLGAYINGVFHSKADNKTDHPDTGFWTITIEDGKPVYSFTKRTDEALTIKVIYQARNIIYDTRNDDPNYQYHFVSEDPPSGGREVPMGDGRTEYTSHAPAIPDGWMFLGWRYIKINGDNHTSVLVNAVHKIQCDYNESTQDTTLSIWEKKEGDEEGEFSKCIDSGIKIGDGITFFAEWKYRQRVIAQTLNIENSIYEANTNGGTVEVEISYTDDKNPSTPEDYIEGNAIVGREVYAAADGTNITITAKNNPRYVFNGWYDESGKLVSRNPSYKYKVVDGGVSTYYARFEIFGKNLTINTSVDNVDHVDNEEGEVKYVAVDCSFSSLSKNHLYRITVKNGAQVENQTVLRSDESGNAQITIYVKDKDSVVFEKLPKNCKYSVRVKEESRKGYSIQGEVTEKTFGTEDVAISLILKKATQTSWIAPGKHYQDILDYVNVNGTIQITPKSSYTLYVKTEYAPSFYTNLSASLCFFNAQGGAQSFAQGTRILMIDKTKENDPSFYRFIVDNDSTTKIALTDFTFLGTTNDKFALPTGESIQACLLFVVDYVGTENAPNGQLSLVYSYGNNSAEAVKPATPKAVVTGGDTTAFTMTAPNANAASVGPFEVKLTISESTPVENTTYEGYDNDIDAIYSVKLSLLNGDTLPEGSYAEVNGKIYHCYNGYIIVSPLSASADEITVKLYSRTPLADAGEQVTLQAELLSAVSTSASVPVGIFSEGITFTCLNTDAYAMDVDIVDKVLTPGQISQVDVALEYEEIDAVKLTVSKKNNDGTYSEKLPNIDFMPTGNGRVTVILGDGFTAEAGETYIFSFVGYADGVPVCRDDCCIVGGYK